MVELKHLAPYLPYRLNTRYDLSDVVGGGHVFRDKLLTTDNVQFVLDYCKPILRNLSDLTKEIEAGGERFVPIHEIGSDIFYNWLKKEFEFIPSCEEESYLESQLIPNDYERYFNIKVFDNHTYFGITFNHPDFDSENMFELHENNYTIDKSFQKSTGSLTFGYKRNSKYILDFKSFVTMWSIPAYRSIMKFELKHWQKLFEWHFDVFGLIESGDAIDINTL